MTTPLPARYKGYLPQRSSGGEQNYSELVNNRYDNVHNEELAKAHEDLRRRQLSLQQEQILRSDSAASTPIMRSKGMNPTPNLVPPTPTPARGLEYGYRDETPASVSSRGVKANGGSGNGNWDDDARLNDGHQLVYKMSKDRSPLNARSPSHSRATTAADTTEQAANIRHSVLHYDERGQHTKVVLEGASVKNMPFDYISPSKVGGGGGEGGHHRDSPSFSGPHSVARSPPARGERRANDAQEEDDEERLLTTKATVFFVGGVSGGGGVVSSSGSVGESAYRAAPTRESPKRRALSEAREVSEAIDSTHGDTSFRISEIEQAFEFIDRRRRQEGTALPSPSLLGGSAAPSSHSSPSATLAGVSVKNQAHDFIAPHDEVSQRDYRPLRRASSASSSSRANSPSSASSGRMHSHAAAVHSNKRSPITATQSSSNSGSTPPNNGYYRMYLDGKSPLGGGRGGGSPSSHVARIAAARRRSESSGRGYSSGGEEGYEPNMYGDGRHTDLRGIEGNGNAQHLHRSPDYGNERGGGGGGRGRQTDHPTSGVSVTNEPYDFVGPVCDGGAEGEFVSHTYLNEPPQSSTVAKFGASPHKSSDLRRDEYTSKGRLVANSAHDYAEEAEDSEFGQRHAAQPRHVAPPAALSPKKLSATSSPSTPINGASVATSGRASTTAVASNERNTPSSNLVGSTSPRRRNRSGSPVVDAVLTARENQQHMQENAAMEGSKPNFRDTSPHHHPSRNGADEDRGAGGAQQAKRAPSLTRIVANIMMPPQNSSSSPLLEGQGKQATEEEGGGARTRVDGGLRDESQPVVPPFVASRKYADPSVAYGFGGGIHASQYPAALEESEGEEDPTVRAQRIQRYYSNAMSMRRLEDEQKYTKVLSPASASKLTPGHSGEAQVEVPSVSPRRFRSPEQRPHVDICQIIPSVPFPSSSEGRNDERAQSKITHQQIDPGMGWAAADTPSRIHTPQNTYETGYVSPQRRVVSYSSSTPSSSRAGVGLGGRSQTTTTTTEAQMLLDTARTTVAMLTEELVGLRREHGQLQKAYAEQGRIAASVKRTSTQVTDLQQLLDAIRAELSKERQMRLKAEEDARAAHERCERVIASEAKLRRERGVLNDRLAGAEEEVVAVKVTAKAAIDQLAAALAMATEGRVQ